jgi:hypothetical protein
LPKHKAPNPHTRHRRLPAAIALVWGAGTAVWAAALFGSTSVELPNADAQIDVAPAALEYEAPKVDTAPAQEAAPPIPPCAHANAGGPGNPPCHWDSGERGGTWSYVWTGQQYLTLIDPKP